MDTSKITCKALALLLMLEFATGGIILFGDNWNARSRPMQRTPKPMEIQMEVEIPKISVKLVSNMLPFEEQQQVFSPSRARVNPIFGSPYHMPASIYDYADESVKRPENFGDPAEIPDFLQKPIYPAFIKELAQNQPGSDENQADVEDYVKSLSGPFEYNTDTSSVPRLLGLIARPFHIPTIYDAFDESIKRPENFGDPDKIPDFMQKPIYPKPPQYISHWQNRDDAEKTIAAGEEDSKPEFFITSTNDNVADSQEISEDEKLAHQILNEIFNDNEKSDEQSNMNFPEPKEVSQEISEDEKLFYQILDDIFNNDEKSEEQSNMNFPEPEEIVSKESSEEDSSNAAEKKEETEPKVRITFNNDRIFVAEKLFEQILNEMFNSVEESDEKTNVNFPEPEENASKESTEEDSNEQTVVPTIFEIESNLKNSEESKNVEKAVDDVVVLELIDSTDSTTENEADRNFYYTAAADVPTKESTEFNEKSEEVNNQEWEAQTDAEPESNEPIKLQWNLDEDSKSSKKTDRDITKEWISFELNADGTKLNGNTETPWEEINKDVYFVTNGPDVDSKKSAEVEESFVKPSETVIEYEYEDY